MSTMAISNRVTEMTGTDYPIIQAPMGWIARARLASAVSNAGGLGIIETSSGEFGNIKADVVEETIAGFHEIIRGLSRQYVHNQEV